MTILPASQVVRLLVPPYVQDDPSLAGVLSEWMLANRVADKLGGKAVKEVLPKPPPEMTTVNADDTIVGVAAAMARNRSPLVVVVGADGRVGRDHGDTVTRGGCWRAECWWPGECPGGDCRSRGFPRRLCVDRD